jgi:hypothetical protein
MSYRTLARKRRVEKVPPLSGDVIPVGAEFS